MGQFQSTHPRGVRRHFFVPNRLSWNVSIHAPAWGATQQRGAGRGGGKRVSIHAPAWGATRVMQLMDNPQFVFQSTHPRGVRPRPSWPDWATPKFQSTHPRGVRQAPPDDRNRLDRCFNPRTRVGCDERKRQFSGAAKMFQSTHPRGVRHPLLQAYYPYRKGFNPRTRVGCDRFASNRGFTT